jgi:hypothetical protein
MLGQKVKMLKMEILGGGVYGNGTCKHSAIHTVQFFLNLEESEQEPELSESETETETESESNAESKGRI